MKDYKPGDKVLVRGEVVEFEPGVGALVEFFSKTDQWQGWIREDLLTSGVVLDFKAENIAAEGIVAALRERHEKAMAGIEGETGWSRAADLIEAQTKPPRIAEPGLYAVVQAGVHLGSGVIGSRQHWARGPKGWTNLDAPGAYLNWTSWDELVDPEVVQS